MVKSRINAIVTIIVLSVLAGCGAPQPPKPVNARLKDDSPYSLLLGRQPKGEADVGLLARCRKIQEYAKTVKGDWQDHWYLAKWDVMEMMQGQWESPTLTFIFADRWPTPESGIKLKKAPLPYWEAQIFAFWLDSSAKVPLIVRQQQRSRVPPHEALKRPTLDYRKPDAKSLYEQVVNAAAKFVRGEGGTRGGFQLVEEYEDFFVVEHRSFPRSLAVTVCKGTYEVHWVVGPSSD
jgi:hypothetical protein